MDKKTFCKRVALWTAIIAAVIMLIIGLCCGKVVEGNLFAEVAKWVLIGLGVIGILEGFVYVLAPLWWHFKIERKQK